MIEYSQEADVPLSSFSTGADESSPLTPLPETLGSSSPFSAYDLFPSNQKIEIIFAQGHRLCLQGSFDWSELSVWFTPLLRGEGSAETENAN